MLRLIKSSFYKEAKTKKQVARFIMQAKQLSFGPQCEQFEVEFAAYHHRRHAVMFNSGSSANFALIRALMHLGKLRPSALVGFSALTWSTNVMPLVQLGLRIFPIDVAMDTLNVSSTTFEDALGALPEKPAALFLTNVLGFCDDIDNIVRLCKSKGILLLEDNCESLGSRHSNTLLGNFGYASTQSFYVGHIMSTIEGGMVITDDRELATMLRIVRAHGWDRNLGAREQKAIRKKHNVKSAFHGKYTFYHDGFNLRPSEINGFIGRNQLPYLEEVIDRREENYHAIARHINQDERYLPLRHDHMQRLANFAIPIVCKSQKIRDAAIQRCEGIVEVRPILAGDMTRHPFYTRLGSSVALPLPTENAWRIHQQGMYFGNNPELTARDLRTIVDVVTQY